MRDCAGLLPVVTHAEPCTEGFDDPSRGNATWRTIYSADRTPTCGLSCGVMTVPPGGQLVPHRHAMHETYFVHAGRGLMVIDGAEHEISTGSTVFHSPFS